MTDAGLVWPSRVDYRAVAGVGPAHKLPVLILRQRRFSIELDARVAWLRRLILQNIGNAGEQTPIFFINLLTSLV